MAFAGVAVAVATIFVCGQQSWAQRMPGFGGQMGPGLGGPFGRHGNLSGLGPPLIPIQELYSDPQYDNVLISPSGRYFSYLSPSSGTGHLNVFVQDTLQLNPPRQVTDAPNDITSGHYAWSRDEQYILWVQNNVTGRNLGAGSHLYRTSISPPGETVDLTPQLPPYTILVDFKTGAGNPNFVGLELVTPNMTVGANPAQGAYPNWYLADIQNPGNLTQITQNPGYVDAWVLDRNLFVRAAKVGKNDGHWTLLTRMSPTSEWVPVFDWDDQDPSGPLVGGDVAMSFNANGSSMYLLSSKGFDTMHLLQINTATGELENDLAHSNKSDVVGVVFNPATYTIDAVSFDYLRRQWVPLNPNTNSLLQTLQTYFNGSADYDVMSASDDGSIWSVERTRSDGPTEWYIFNTATRRPKFLFSDKPNLNNYKMAKTQGVVIPTPDGLSMPAYLTLPVPPPDMPDGRPTPAIGAKGGRADFPLHLPLIVFPHAGPTSRDRFGFQPLVQLFANRGYAVIQPQYRGSSGFGKGYMNAGDGQWGLKMQDDLVTAVNWAVDQNIADPARVAIYGLQYGGYAALMGLTRNPEVFTCCAAALMPISNVSYIVDTFPAFANTTGLNQSDAMDALISPIYHLSDVKAPLLLGEGAMNDRMSVASTLAISAALDYRGIPNELYVYGDEFNGITKEPNRMDFASRLEQFFGKYLGGHILSPLVVNNSTVHVVNATQLLNMGGPGMPGGMAGGMMPNPQLGTGANPVPTGLAAAPSQGPEQDATAGYLPGIAAAAEGPGLGTGYQDAAQGPDVGTGIQDTAAASPDVGAMFQGDTPAITDTYGATGPAMGTGYPDMQGSDAAAAPALLGLLDPTRYAGLSNRPSGPAGDVAAAPVGPISKADLTTLIGNSFLPQGAAGPQAAAPAPYLGV